uniref:Uncharacterized protein n=1 Tax=Arundo donax TaxID=35708 RepID=A0A0A9FK90_ARUDO
MKMFCFLFPLEK